MLILFYLFNIFSIFFTILILINQSPVYALLYLVLLILSISGNFFILGSYFLGTLEIIIYAGSIIVLFLFIIMLIGHYYISYNKFFNKNTYKKNIFFIFCLIFILFFLLFKFFFQSNKIIFFHFISIKNISFCLFRKYFFLVELVSLILLTSVFLICFFIKKNTSNFFIITKD